MLHKLVLFEKKINAPPGNPSTLGRGRWRGLLPLTPPTLCPRLASALRTRGRSFLSDAWDCRRPCFRTSPQHRLVPAPSPGITLPGAGVRTWRGPKHSSLSLPDSSPSDNALQVTPPQATPLGAPRERAGEGACHLHFRAPIGRIPGERRSCIRSSSGVVLTAFRGSGFRD